MPIPRSSPLHDLLDFGFGPDGAAHLVSLLDDGADPNGRSGPLSETPLHVATRRRRAGAVATLLDRGAAVDARNGAGKTAYAHAVRRGFDDVARVLLARGASTDLAAADELAVALANGRLSVARSIIEAHPDCARTGNPEEDRVLADLAGRSATEPVALLIAAGADLGAPGLDGGTPLHQAAWFGQPANGRLLIEAGAPLNVFDPVHGTTPIGWAAHGSRHSDGAAERQAAYVDLATSLMIAGASLHYPDDPTGAAYLDRLLADASSAVCSVLRSMIP